MELAERLASRLMTLLMRNARLAANVPIGRAQLDIRHQRRVRKGAIYVFEDVTPPERVANLITNVGRDYLHLQGYGTTGLGANGLNWIGLSNDPVGETNASTTLSNEISANGLQRAQGTVSHTGGTNSTGIQKVFTATGAQSAQKAALFTASSGGVMNHVLGFTQRSLITDDTLTMSFTITLG